jgi:hypothetical protein
MFAEGERDFFLKVMDDQVTSLPALLGQRPRALENAIPRKGYSAPRLQGRIVRLAQRSASLGNITGRGSRCWSISGPCKKAW